MSQLWSAESAGLHPPRPALLLLKLISYFSSERSQFKPDKGKFIGKPLLGPRERGLGSCYGKGERRRGREREKAENEKRRRKSGGEGRPNIWPLYIRASGRRVCQVGTEACWEDLEAKSALVYNIGILALVPGLKPNRNNFILLNSLI